MSLTNDVQYNCLRNVCVNPPEEPFEVALWHYIVTTLAVVLGKNFLLFRWGCLSPTREYMSQL